ncbi:T-cell ecto-ADP-ribosyltransferase 1-like [Oratosquilla oratoria]|uniref:T-cell ecto-ADP-ribosyltransferase 1-like n=1 Tax=Oratosquilla oratoria TaxID=337810 RepID=UPI003F76A81A
MEETRETRFVEIDADAIYIEDSSTFWKKSMGMPFLSYTLNDTMDKANEYFMEEVKENKELAKAWDKSKFQLSNILKGHQEGALGNACMEWKTAIVAYTLEHPNLYREFNKKSRHMNNLFEWHDFPFKGFWLYLHKAVSQCGLSDELCILYRGCGIKFEAAIGTKMKFQHFVSTTANRAIAEKFAEGGTLFVFQVYNALNISSLSIFPNEEEYLLTPNDGFEVVDIKQGKYKEIYLKTLSFSFIH